EPGVSEVHAYAVIDDSNMVRLGAAVALHPDNLKTYVVLIAQKIVIPSREITINAVANVSPGSLHFDRLANQHRAIRIHRNVGIKEPDALRLPRKQERTEGGEKDRRQRQFFHGI